VTSKRTNPRRCRFVLALDVDARSPAGAWVLARRCEQLLRDQAPAGVEVQPAAFRRGRGQGRRGDEKAREFADAVEAAGRSPQASTQAAKRADASARRLKQAADRTGSTTPSRVHAPPRFDDEGKS
jgi:hypothetical protein